MYFVIIATLCAVADLLFTIGASEVPGSLLNLMRQGSIPITVAFSYWLLRTKFNRFHYVSCALVAGSVILSFYVNYSRMDWGMYKPELILLFGWRLVCGWSDSSLSLSLSLLLVCLCCVELTTPHVQHHRHPSPAERAAQIHQQIEDDDAETWALEPTTVIVPIATTLPGGTPLPATHTPQPEPNAPQRKPQPVTATQPALLVSHSHTNTQLFIYGSIFLFSLFPGSIALVAKEYVYKVFDLDVVFLSAYVSTYQVVVSFLLIPIAVVADSKCPHTHTRARLPLFFLFDPATQLNCVVLFGASAVVNS